MTFSQLHNQVLSSLSILLYASWMKTQCCQLQDSYCERRGPIVCHTVSLCILACLPAIIGTVSCIGGIYWSQACVHLPKKNFWTSDIGAECVLHRVADWHGLIDICMTSKNTCVVVCNSNLMVADKLKAALQTFWMPLFFWEPILHSLNCCICQAIILLPFRSRHVNTVLYCRNYRTLSQNWHFEEDSISSWSLSSSAFSIHVKARTMCSNCSSLPKQWYQCWLINRNTSLNTIEFILFEKSFT